MKTLLILSIFLFMYFTATMFVAPAFPVFVKWGASLALLVLAIRVNEPAPSFQALRRRSY